MTLSPRFNGATITFRKAPLEPLSSILASATYTEESIHVRRPFSHIPQMNQAVSFSIFILKFDRSDPNENREVVYNAHFEIEIERAPSELLLLSAKKSAKKGRIGLEGYQASLKGLIQFQNKKFYTIFHDNF